MSHHAHQPAQDQAPGGPVNHEAGVNMKLIIGVGVVSLVIFAISVVVAGVMLKADTDHYNAMGGEPPKARFLGAGEVGIVDQAHFDDDTRLDKWRHEKKTQLEGYSWVDRKQGVIRIPIDQAMKEVVRQSGGGGAQ